MKVSLDHILPQVVRPSRYLGNEINAVHKDLDAVSVKALLAFPDVYEVGMSHLGFQLLYHLLNSRDDVAAERVFAPWTDMEYLLRKHGVPLFSLESRRPASQFDIIGFSLQYELSYTNVLAMLDLGGIPLRWDERGAGDPLVIAGGPCTANPEPVAAFFDALVVGEGEEVVGEIVNAFKQWKEGDANRADLLRRLATIRGVYVPALYSVSCAPDGIIASIDACPPAPERITKRIVQDLDLVPYPSGFIVPFSQIIHDRINVEIARGCTRGCRFCQAGMTYRPLRERTRSLVESLAERACGATGWEELSLLSLSSGDYSDIKTLLVHLASRFSLRETALSFPSLRAETLDSTIVNVIQQGRKTGFAIAPEAGTERLRRVVNKNLAEEQILETCRRVFAAGWKSIKLYFMIGLPTETKGDVEGIVELAEKVWAQGRGMKQGPHVTVSVSTFIPKPHTPFQWARMIDADEIVERQALIRTRLNRRRFRYKWHDPAISLLEGVMARGDRRLADVIEEAFKSGCRFDGWSDRFNQESWNAAFCTHGVDPKSYLRAREIPARLPWDHIDCGVEKAFLEKEWEAAYREQATPDCRSGDCNQCGVCDFATVFPQIAGAAGAEETKQLTRLSSPARSLAMRVNKIRLCFSKTGEHRFLSHLETIRVFSRAARRAKLPIRYSQGYHPQPRIIFGPALPVGMESLIEYVDMEFVEMLPVSEARDRLNRELPAGLSVTAGKEISLKTPAIADSLYEMSYTVPCRGVPSLDALSFADLGAAVESFLSRSSILVSRFRKGKKATANIRPAVTALSLSEDRTLSFTVRVDQGESTRPTDVVATIFGLPEEDRAGLSICKMSMELREAWDQS